MLVKGSNYKGPAAKDDQENLKTPRDASGDTPRSLRK